MYKIFGNSHLMVFAPPRKAGFFRENGAIFLPNPLALTKKLKINKQASGTWVVLSENTHAAFRQFKKQFTCINAAGGLVYNRSGKILLIKRNGYWDLPKGKQDKGEILRDTALREVEEECGLDKLSVHQKICHTYHYYFMHGKWYLKKTTWYILYYNGNKTPVPQQEEGITRIKWVNAKNEISTYMKRSFPLIRFLLGAGHDPF